MHKVTLENGEEVQISDESYEALQKAVQELKRSRFVPKAGEWCFYIAVNGDILTETWNNDAFDMDLLKMGNCYRTREEAIYERDRRKAIVELWDIADELNDGWVPDWRNSCQGGYHIIWDCCNECGGAIFRWGAQGSTELPYFKSRELTEQAADRLGEEKLKMIFRVK